MVMFSCDFITFDCFVTFDELFDWLKLGWFRLAEFAKLYFSMLLKSTWSEKVPLLRMTLF